MNSAIYQGWVRHRRYAPIEHSFQYRLFMMYLDLEELPDLFDHVPLWSARRFALAQFRRGDHVGNPNQPLAESIRQLVEESGAPRPAGPIRLLTHLRYFGHIFNPASFYFCYDAEGKNVETIVTEITNTPWKERHCYVHARSGDAGNARRMVFRFDKEFHVSPFMEMNQQYEWRFMDPGRNLLIHMENFQSERKVFDATMNLDRIEITALRLNAKLAQFPAMTLRVVAGIYWNALRLHLKGAPFHPHPKTTNSLKESRT